MVGHHAIRSAIARTFRDFRLQMADGSSTVASDVRSSMVRRIPTSSAQVRCVPDELTSVHQIITSS